VGSGIAAATTSAAAARRAPMPTAPPLTRCFAAFPAAAHVTQGAAAATNRGGALSGACIQMRGCCNVGLLLLACAAPRPPNPPTTHQPPARPCTTTSRHRLQAPHRSSRAIWRLRRPDPAPPQFGVHPGGTGRPGGGASLPARAWVHTCRGGWLAGWVDGCWNGWALPAGDCWRGCVLLNSNCHHRDARHTLSKHRAKVLAVSAAGSAAAGATAFLNLECGDCHGDDAAVSTLIRSGLTRVVIGLRHPQRHLRDSAVTALRAAGVRTDVLAEHGGVVGSSSSAGAAVMRGDVASNGSAAAAAAAAGAGPSDEPSPETAALLACLRANEGLLHRAAYRRPLSILKFAMTLDGKIATAAGHAAWVSSTASRCVWGGLVGVMWKGAWLGGWEGGREGGRRGMNGEADCRFPDSIKQDQRAPPKPTPEPECLRCARAATRSWWAATPCGATTRTSRPAGRSCGGRLLYSYLAPACWCCWSQRPSRLLSCNL